jgi:hypothetical protein
MMCRAIVSSRRRELRGKQSMIAPHVGLGSLTMDASTTPQQEAAPSDRSALLLMLAYVEAECRRLGAHAAAQHAAMAAALVPEGQRAAAGAVH